MNVSSIIKYSVPAMVFIAIMFQWKTSISSASGPDPGYTNAPGEGNCTSCHTGTSLQTPGTNLKVTMNTSTTLEYIPDSTYDITIKFTNTSASRYGFEMTVLTSSNTMAGSFTSNTTTQIKNTTIGSITRYYIEHRANSISGSGGTATWTFKWTAPSSNVGNLKFYIALNAANGDGTDGGDVIYADALTVVPSSKLPTASFTYTPANPCTSDSVFFNGSGTNTPTGYSWTFSGANISTSFLQNPKVKFSASGSAKLVVSNKYGLSQPVVKFITVKNPPADTISPKGPVTICEGDSIKLTAPFADRYVWNTADTTPYIWVKKAGNYFVTASFSATCGTTTKSVSVSVLQRPVVKLTSTLNRDTGCLGDVFVLRATPGYTTYTFYNGFSNNQSGPTDSFVVKNAFAGNTFYVIARNSLGCAGDTSNKIKIYVKPRLTPPSVFFKGSTTSSVNISWSAVNGAKYYQVSSDSGKSWHLPSSGSTGLTHTETNLKSGTSILMIVRGMDGSVCEGRQGTVVAKTQSCSQIGYKLYSDSAVCPGYYGHVNFFGISEPKFSISLNNSAPTRDTNYTILINKDTLLSFFLFDSTKLNCPPVQENITIKTYEIPQLTVQVPVKKQFCKGELIRVDATPGFENYIFYRNGVMLKSTSNSFIESTFNDKDTVYAVGHTSAGCGAMSNLVGLSVNTVHPGFTASHSNLFVQFNDTTTKSRQRTWKFGDNTTDTSKSPAHTFPAAGTYSVKLIVMNNNGCTDSTSQSLTLSASGLEPQQTETICRIYPNPFTGILNVDISSPETKTIDLRIMDIGGREVSAILNLKLNAGSNLIPVETTGFQPGFYMVSITGNNLVVNSKIIKTQ